MSIIAIIAGIVAIPFIVGWFLGRNQIDPDTPEGKEHYEQD